ncbi:MAG TPA: transglycosylase domain-containing protein, partial [Acidimicrobiales bacterium]
MHIALKFALAIVAAGAVLAGAVAALAVPAGMVAHVGSGEPLQVALGQLAQRSYVYAADASVLATLHGEENRQPVRLADVPPHVISAILAVEDSGFWVHDGVDARGMLRALRANVDAGGISQGGSTITQQLVKLDLLTDEQTLDRKVQEIVLALRLERELTKEQILSRYLNTVYFGNHAYGVQAAAETYFGVAARDLDVGQAALLAGMIRNPIVYNPVRFPEKAQERRSVALDRMLDVGAITEDDRTFWDASPMPTELHQVRPPPDDYFAEAVKSQLLRDERLGETYEQRERAVFQGGLRIYTTFDPRAQQQAIAARDANLPLVDGVFAAGTDPATGQPRVGSAAIVSIEPTSGAVRTMVGGPGFDRYRFNLVTQNRRQAGSSFKTFVLATLMEQGRSPEDVVNGTGPCRFSNPLGSPDPYEPKNFGNEHGGVATVREQTLRSSNCAFVRLGLIAGTQNVIDTAHRLGVKSDIPSAISIPLGTAAVTPMDMASGYATLANDGVYNPPYLIERVDDRDGRTLFSHAPRPSRVVSPQTARLVSSVLQDNVLRGTGRAAQIRTGNPAAGKTGTHQGSRDAWFVGYSMQLATAVWIGGLGAQFTITLGGRGITGATYPARIWGDYMTAWHQGKEAIPFPAPDARAGGAFLIVPNGQDLQPLPAPPRPNPTPAPFPTPGPPGVPVTPPGQGQGGGGGGGD